MGLRSPRKIEGVRGCHMQHLHWGCMMVSGFQLTSSLGLKKMLKLQLTLMPAATCLDNNLVAGMAVEKDFAVQLQLVGCKTNITNT